MSKNAPGKIINQKIAEMIWGPIILIIAGIFATGTAFYLHQKNNRLKFLGLLFAAAVFVTVEFAVLFHLVVKGYWADLITLWVIEWGHIYCLALILSSLLLFVRESKPEFSQFPRVYSILPLLSIVSCLLVFDTVMLKDWLISIYQGGAAIVALLIYGIYTYRNSIYRTVASGAILFFASFLTSLIIPEYPIAWQLLLAASIITTFSGYLVVEKHFVPD